MLGKLETGALSLRKMRCSAQRRQELLQLDRLRRW
jgi:hypothetical protein